MIPRNEMEVIVLFTQQARAAGFEIVSVQTNFPDAIIRHGETEYKVEFEYKASNFWAHKHNPTMCDLIICWINDDEYPLLPIIALSDPNWPQTPIVSPPYQERLVGYWRTRALVAEKKLEEIQEKIKEKAERGEDLVDLPVPEEVKMELDELLERAIEKAKEVIRSPHADIYQTTFIFGELIEEVLANQPTSPKTLYIRKYARQLLRLILSS